MEPAVATKLSVSADADAHVHTTPDVHGILETAFDQVLDAIGHLGYPVSSDDNYTETAARAARAMLELVRPADEIEREIADMLGRTFPAQYEGMVVSKHNTCFGMCPHHLLPVVYRVSVAYLPAKHVLGISKLSRIVHLHARRPILQEDLTHGLAEILHDRLASRGSAVFVEGLHMCMAARGIEAHEASLVTSAVRGAFLDQPATRQEFLDLVSAPRSSLI